MNLYCNWHAKNKPIDIIYISFFDHIGMHSFLCMTLVVQGFLNNPLSIHSLFTSTNVVYP